MRRWKTALWLLLFLTPSALVAQRPLTPEQLKRAEGEAPRLAEVMGLKPGMVVADVGAGFGAMTIVLSKWLGPAGRVYATEIGAPQLKSLRESVSRERLDNVTILEGATGTTNLPDSCCDGIFLRDVYHHLGQPVAIHKSIAMALKPGGRLAIMDFEPESGSKVPDGVPADRTGHGVLPASVVAEGTAAGLTHVKTVPSWQPDAQGRSFFLVLFEKR
jgi:ubiquinone/menaquinone biosynthesis C-methylase UbiE